MGRVLAFAFLGFLVFWGLTFLSYVTKTLDGFLDRVGIELPDKVVLLANSVLSVAEGVIFLLVPLALIVLVAVGIAVRGGSTQENPDPPWDGWERPKVAVALTAWNDEEAIRLAVREFESLDYVVETIVVDNNSEDGTASAARQEGARVVIEEAPGYGNVCIRGLREALQREDANIVALAEGDMTFTGSDMAKMIPYLEDLDMVVGTRTTYELTSKDSQMDWFMTWGNLFLATLIRLRYWDWTFLGRVRLTDVGCTFRILRKDSLARIVDRLYVGEDYFSPHMILSALRNQLRMIEVPIKFRKRVGISKGASSSRLRAIRTGLQMLREILT